MTNIDIFQFPPIYTCPDRNISGLFYYQNVTPCHELRAQRIGGQHEPASPGIHACIATKSGMRAKWNRSTGRTIMPTTSGHSTGNVHPGVPDHVGGRWCRQYFCPTSAGVGQIYSIRSTRRVPDSFKRATFQTSLPFALVFSALKKAMV